MASFTALKKQHVHYKNRLSPLQNIYTVGDLLVSISSSYFNNWFIGLLESDIPHLTWIYAVDAILEHLESDWDMNNLSRLYNILLQCISY